MIDIILTENIQVVFNNILQKYLWANKDVKDELFVQLKYIITNYNIGNVSMDTYRYIMGQKDIEFFKLVLDKGLLYKEYRKDFVTLYLNEPDFVELILQKEEFSVTLTHIRQCLKFNYETKDIIFKYTNFDEILKNSRREMTEDEIRFFHTKTREKKLNRII